MVEQNDNDYKKCINALDNLIKIIIGAHDNCKYEGKDCRGAVLYRFEPGYDADLAYEGIHSCIGDISEFLHKQLEPPKPQPDYKKEVFDLILSKPMPGVEFIEVNESQKKFVVHYRHQEVPTAVPMIPPVFHDRLIAEHKLTKE